MDRPGLVVGSANFQVTGRAGRWMQSSPEKWFRLKVEPIVSTESPERRI